MKIILFSRRQIDHPTQELRQIFDAIEAHKFDYVINEEFAAVVRAKLNMEIPAKLCYTSLAQVDMSDSTMVCCGGDGTILEGVYTLGGKSVNVVGVNYGHMGFLAASSPGMVPYIFEKIADNNLQIEQRTMLQVEGDLETSFPFALNEFSVQRHGAGMVRVDCWVDGNWVAAYNGDGVLVSTPTGSTAYSLSVGGPILSPDCRVFVISPLAPHNLAMRAVVVPDSCTIELRVVARDTQPFVTLDNRTYDSHNDARYTIKLAPQRAFLSRAYNNSFYDTLRQKMMWGVDIRTHE